MQTVIEDFSDFQQLLSTSDGDRFSITITDHIRSDGSGMIKVKRETGIDFSQCEREHTDKIQKGFSEFHDKKMMEKNGWTEEQLRRYRETKTEIEKEAKKQVGGKRGKIRTFTNQSRKRLMDTMQTLDYDALTDEGYSKPKFLTLTYPYMYPDKDVAKKHMQTFLKRIRRAYPEASAIWKMEPQKRGAPHFHMIFFKLPRIEKLKISKMWSEVVGYVYQDRSLVSKGIEDAGWTREPFTRIEEIKSLKGIMWYTAKYISKAPDIDFSDRTTESLQADTAGFNSVAYLTARSFKENFELIERIITRALSMDYNFIDDKNASEGERKRNFMAQVGDCIARFAFPDEKDQLCPSCGRIWGKHNKEGLKAIKKAMNRFFIDYEVLMTLKKYAHLTRNKELTINDDLKGFTLYLNDEIERSVFYQLLNSRLTGHEIVEEAPF